MVDIALVFFRAYIVGRVDQRSWPIFTGEVKRQCLTTSAILSTNFESFVDDKHGFRRLETFSPNLFKKSVKNFV